MFDNVAARDLAGAAGEGDLRPLLEGDHERLEKLYECLLAAFQAEARDDIVRFWSEFETGLSRHMDVEERWLLPALADADPAETRELLNEHVQIRRKLTELGVAVDLHCLRADVLEAFLATLRRHSAREEALAYLWAETNLPAETKSEIHQRLLNRVRLHKKSA